MTDDSLDEAAEGVPAEDDPTSEATESAPGSTRRRARSSRGGSRSGEPRSREPRSGGRRWIPPLLVAALIAGIVGMGSLFVGDDASESEATVIAEPIRSSVLLCPEPGTGGNLGVRVTGAIVPGQPGQGGEGEAGLRTLPGAESASSNLKQPGEQGQI